MIPIAWFCTGYRLRYNDSNHLAAAIAWYEEYVMSKTLRAIVGEGKLEPVEQVDLKE